MKLVYLLLASATPLPATSQAKSKPQYASNSPEIRDWYKSRKLTDAAAKRFAFKSCCDGSDKVETQFKVDKATGDDKWYYQKGLRVGRSAAGRNLVGRTLSHRGSRAVLPYTASRPASSLREGGCDGFASPPRRRHAANSHLPLLHYRLMRMAIGQGHTSFVGTRSTCAMSLCRMACSPRLSHLMVTPAQFFSVTVP